MESNKGFFRGSIRLVVLITSGIYNTNPSVELDQEKSADDFFDEINGIFLVKKVVETCCYKFRGVRCLWFDFYELKKGQDVIKMFEKS